MLSPDERRLVESIREAKTIRIIINEGKGDKAGEVNLFFPILNEATKRLRYNLRWTMQDYLNAVIAEAQQNKEDRL